MQIRIHDGDESIILIQEEKFSSFIEMLDLGWSMNHHRSNDVIVVADSDEATDVEIINDSFSRAKMSDKNSKN